MRFVLSLLLLSITTTMVSAGEGFLLKDGQRIVFLGDSNTYAGKYIAYLDAYLCTRFPDKRFELINLGLPSETVSAFRRPITLISGRTSTTASIAPSNCPGRTSSSFATA